MLAERRPTWLVIWRADHAAYPLMFGCFFGKGAAMRYCERHYIDPDDLIKRRKVISPLSRMRMGRAILVDRYSNLYVINRSKVCFYIKVDKSTGPA